VQRAIERTEESAR